jgi:hypothetical protein
VCLRPFDQSQPTVVVPSCCNHALHEHCWAVWACHMVACPVCHTGSPALRGWQANLCNGDLSFAHVVNLFKVVRTCIGRNPLPIPKSTLWTVLLSVWWWTSRIRAVTGTDVGWCYSLSIGLVWWYWCGHRIGGLLAICIHLTVLVINTVLYMMFDSRLCQMAEPELYAEMESVRSTAVATDDTNE